MTKNRGEPYFFVMALILIAIVVGGFAPPVFLAPGGVLAKPPLIHFHGAVFLSWFVLFAVQARLVGAGNVRLHMRLGKLSIIIAAAMVLLGYFVTRGAYARADWSIAGLPPAASTIFPVTDIVNFTIAYCLGVANRRSADTHKRFMLLAGMLIIDPAAFRLLFAVGAAGPMIVFGEILLFASLLAYDWFHLRRLHWASLLGLVLFVAATIAKLNFASHPSWTSFTEVLFG
jgi:hypothetical protein